MTPSTHKQKIVWVLVAIIAIVVIVLGIAHAKKDSRNSKVTIGLILPMTGIAQSYGENALKGAQAAVAKDGDVSLALEDEKCDAAATLSAFQKLVDIDHANIIIGPLCGSPQEALAPVVKNNPLPIIAPAAAARSLFSESGDTMFNIQYSLENEGAAIANRMYADGHKKVVIVGYKNAFSESEVNGFVAAYKGAVISQIILADNTADLNTPIAKLKTQDFDGIFSTDISFLFSQGISMLHRYGISAQVYSPYSVEDPTARKLAEGVIYSFPGGMTGDLGATYGLTYDAVTKAIILAKVCNNNKVCMLKKLREDNMFDSDGTSTRPIIFKKIVNGVPKLL